MVNNTAVEQYKSFYFKRWTQKWAYLQFLQNTFAYSQDIFVQGLEKIDEDNTRATTPRIKVLDLWQMDADLGYNSYILKKRAIKKQRIVEAVNQRTLLPDELVFDFDNQPLKLAELKAFKIIETIKKKKKIFFYGLFYNGHSYHLHIYYRNLLNSRYYSRSEREDIRKKYLASAGSDLQLASERHLIALEFTPHYKYNKPKRLVFGNWYIILEKANINMRGG